MKTSLIAVVLGLATLAAAQQPATTQPQAGAPAQGAAAQGPVIKDPAEYNAYVGAIQQQDPNAKISGLEAFVTQYPNSIVKKDALEALMGAYQSTNNGAKMGETADRLLQADPNNMRALALMAYTSRITYQNNQDPAKAPQLATAMKGYGEKGLAALPSYTKPENVSDADFAKLKDQMSAIFNGAVGLGALQEKDYANASKSLKVAADANPTDFSLVYPTALAFISANPPDLLNGIFYAGKASAVAPANYQAQIEKYAKAQYVKYHGGDDGWPETLAQIKSGTMPQIKPAPTPAEQAHNLVTTKKPEEMDFAEWQLVLTKGSQEDANTVWNAIKGKSLQFQALLLKASSTSLDLAASLDDIDAKKKDVELTMRAEIPAKLLATLKEGTQIQVAGTPDTYTPDPFVITMIDGGLLKAATPTPAPKKPATGAKRPVHH
ncbi:MAG TPA: hypothetical protein VLK33_20885 [Terriglobales bacterium]|nr:hypothetical protein [Terriglobales bacterium]